VPQEQWNRLFGASPEASNCRRQLGQATRQRKAAVVFTILAPTGI
jgi:hypothetical protein